MKVIACVAWGSLFVFCPSAWAQGSAGPPGAAAPGAACISLDLLSAECATEFAEWQRAEHEWRDWMAKYGARTVYGRFGSRPAERLQRPDIPVWAGARCDLLDRSRFAPDDVCQFLAETLAYDWPEHLETPEPPPVTRVPKPLGETGDFWTWFRKSLHYDGFWVVPDTRSRSFLLAGVHVAWAQISERMYLFGPGVMLVRMNDGAGNSVFRPAQTWGISIRLQDVKLFNSQSEFSLYFNVANGRIHGESPHFVSESRGMTVVGFSISAKK